MISKSMGQILLVSAVMHVLFNLGDKELDSTISPAAIEAAINFVEVCCQQAAYIAGRGELDKELKLIVQGTTFLLVNTATLTFLAIYSSKKYHHIKQHSLHEL